MASDKFHIPFEAIKRDYFIVLMLLGLEESDKRCNHALHKIIAIETFRKIDSLFQGVGE